MWPQGNRRQPLRQCGSRTTVCRVQDQREPTQADPARRVERTFAQRMRDLRQERGLSQAKLATRLRKLGLNIDPSAITRIEKNADTTDGARAIFLGEAALIARSLGVRLPEMLRETVTPAEQLESAVGAFIAANTVLKSLEERLNDAQETAEQARQQYEQTVRLLDEDDRAEPSTLLLIDQANQYKRLQELSTRHAALFRYFTYLAEQEQKLAAELHNRDPETERFTFLDRQARHRWVLDKIVETVREIVQIQAELKQFQEDLQSSDSAEVND